MGSNTYARRFCDKCGARTISKGAMDVCPVHGKISMGETHTKENK